MSTRIARSMVLLSLLGGCVTPQVMVVDQKTALERQAAGSYPTLENEIEQAGMKPAPEPLTRAEIAQARERSGDGPLGELGDLYVASETHADVVDRYLVQRCLGEAQSGLLEPRPSDCIGTADSGELARVVARENLHRRQLWQLLAREHGTSPERVLELWREPHLEQVVCGGLIETSAGWEPKPC